MDKADFGCNSPQQTWVTAHAWKRWLSLLLVSYWQPSRRIETKFQGCKFESLSSICFYIWRVSMCIGRQVMHPFCFNCCPFISCFSSFARILFSWLIISVQWTCTPPEYSLNLNHYFAVGVGGWQCDSFVYCALPSFKEEKCSKWKWVNKWRAQEPDMMNLDHQW